MGQEHRVGREHQVGQEHQERRADRSRRYLRARWRPVMEVPPSMPRPTARPTAQQSRWWSHLPPSVPGSSQFAADADQP